MPAGEHVEAWMDKASHHVDLQESPVTALVFMMALQAMPPSALRNRGSMRWYADPEVVDDFTDFLASRMTMMTGRSSDLEDVTQIFGIEVELIPALAGTRTVLLMGQDNAVGACLIDPDVAVVLKNAGIRGKKVGMADQLGHH